MNWQAIKLSKIKILNAKQNKQRINNSNAKYNNNKYTQANGKNVLDEFISELISTEIKLNASDDDQQQSGSVIPGNNNNG